MPTRDELGDRLVVFFANGQDTGGGTLVATADDQLATIRRSERVFVRRSAADIDALRAELITAIAGHEGHFDTSGGWTDQPTMSLTVVGPDGVIHHTAYDGQDRDPGTQRAVERIRALIDEVANGGAADPTAPIGVRVLDGGTGLEGEAVRWPASVPQPTDPVGSTIRDRRYSGKEATTLRNVLGTGTGRLVILPGGKKAAVYWWADLDRRP